MNKKFREGFEKVAAGRGLAATGAFFGGAPGATAGAQEGREMKALKGSAKGRLTGGLIGGALLGGSAAMKMNKFHNFMGQGIKALKKEPEVPKAFMKGLEKYHGDLRKVLIGGGLLTGGLVGASLGKRIGGSVGAFVGHGPNKRKKR